MNFLITETGQTQNLRLEQAGGSSNMAREWIDSTVGLEACGLDTDNGDEAKMLAGSEVSQSLFHEWVGIINTAQSNINRRFNYELKLGKPIHPATERDIKQIFNNELNKSFDEVFALRNAVEAERAAWLSLEHGKVVALSFDVEFKHYRSSVDMPAPHDWLMHMTHDFMIAVPNGEDGRRFTVTAEQHYMEVGDNINLIHDEYDMPPALSHKQQDEIMQVFNLAARQRIGKDSSKRIVMMDD